jgi:uncharacterized paraquat-inducible protein A
MFANKIMSSGDVQFPAPANKNPIESRIQAAQTIASNPHDFKICEGCESIVREATTICPSCFAYRFEDDPIQVIAQAVVLASKEPKENFI